MEITQNTMRTDILEANAAVGGSGLSNSAGDPQDMRSGKGNIENIRRKRKRRINQTGWAKKKTKPKAPDFDAFAVEETVVTQAGDEVVQTTVVAPEHGIHSQEWAANIAPQGGFLSLPTEIRNQIYRLYFGEDATINNPRKKGSKYTTTKESTTITRYIILSRICRQTYVDVVGGSLLYTFARFSFSSPDTMTKYLSCINPAHKDAIQTLHLSISLTKAVNTIPDSALELLGSMHNLNCLAVTISLSIFLCTESPVRRMPFYLIADHYRASDKTIARLKAAKWTALEGKLDTFQLLFEGTPRILPGGRHSHREEWSRRLDKKDKATVKFSKEVAKIVLKKV